MTTRREVVMRLIALGMLSPTMAACKDGGNGMGLFAKKEVVLSVVLFNYRNRSIFDVLLNGDDIGVAGPWGGGGGAMTGVTVPLGRQTLSWRLGGPEGMPGNGDTVTVANVLTLTADQVSSDDCYLGVHIYFDNTAELTLSQYIPEMTPKGERMYKERQLHGR
jgi:hypothetical protein